MPGASLRSTRTTRYTSITRISISKGSISFLAGRRRWPIALPTMSSAFSSLDYYFAGQPLQFTRTLGNPLLDVNQFELASFIQNDWKMTKKFNLSFGARYEAQTNINAYHNLDPRMGFAYQLTKTMALRGGLGVFHQRLDIGIVEGVMRLDGARQQQIVIAHPSFPDPFLNFDVSSIPISRRTRALELVLPYTTDASISLEKSLPKGLALTFSWYGNRGMHL